MKLIIGLGNPGAEHENTRHNIGFMFIDYLIQRKQIKLFLKKKLDCIIGKTSDQGSAVLLMKPQTFMNSSGEAVVKVTAYYGSISHSDIIVVHDDLDLKIGEFKIQLGKGPRVHNGVLSVEEKLGTKNFWRLRIGIENRENKNIPGSSYVLSKFTAEEQTVLNKLFPVIEQQLFLRLFH